MLRNLTGLAALIIAAPAAADDFSDALKDLYRTNLSQWATSPVLIDAVRNQNAMTSAYDLNQIEALDQTWRSEVGQETTPTITPVLDNDAADFLRERVEISQGQITEIFVMDAQGLNVAASAVTSDFWQGDEAKHQETFGMGSDGFHISEVELDESTQRYQAQVSFTLVDPETGEAVGAMTVGVDAESLM